MPGTIKTEMRGPALIITFSRPHAENAMTVEMAALLYNVLKPVATDPSIRAVMLKGDGDHFMNGIDMNIYSKDVMAGVEQKNEVLLHYHQAIRELHTMSKPVMAVVTGKAARAGLSFVLVSDLVLASSNAKFNTGYTKLGMTPDGGVSYFLTRKVGMAKATEMLMLNEEFDAAEAHRLNLVNAVLEPAQLEKQANEWIDRLASGPTKALGGVKQLVDKAYMQNLYDHIGLEHTYWGACSRTFDFRAAVKAYFNKDPIKFTGA